MPNNTQYYCVGFIWEGFNPESQLSRFLKESIWENGFDDKYQERVDNVQVGSRIAAKTTYTKREDDKIISVLAIHATGTVTENPQNGKILKVKWDKPFEAFEIKNKGAYRSTISRINQRDTISQIFKSEVDSSWLQIPFYLAEKTSRSEIIFPCFFLTKSNWDDYGYQTSYNITYYLSAKEIIPIGSAKFLNKLDDNNNILQEAFTSLDEHICSLGQSNDYYLNLRNLISKEIADQYLDSVNDLAINKGLISSFEHETAYKASLLRNSEAQKALREGYRIYKGLKIDNNIKFTFKTQIGNATEEHAIKFDYSIESELPHRIKVLIGKNGTGKTQYIARLASTLSGYQTLGSFSTKYLPPFSRVIAVSYSLFDRFPKPKKTKTYSYYYCGFQGGKGFLTENQIQIRMKDAFLVLEQSGRITLFGKYLSKVLSDELTLDILDEDWHHFNSKEFTLYDERGYSKYSSGQIIMILMLAEVLAYITEESLLIFDEPETHLHPNSISLFINVINKILERYDSYAIFSTHSPQIIQEIPSKDIIVIERLGNTPSTRGLNIETFGENLNTITERIFQTINQDEYYRNYLHKLSSEHSYEEIVNLFNQKSLPLSLNAKIYLQSLYP